MRSLERGKKGHKEKDREHVMTFICEWPANSLQNVYIGFPFPEVPSLTPHLLFTTTGISVRDASIFEKQGVWLKKVEVVFLI